MEQKRLQPFIPESNGKYSPPSLPAPPFMGGNQAEKLNLRQILAVLRRRAVVISGVATVVTAAVWFSALSSKPVYEGDFRVLVEPVTSENKLAGLSQASGIGGANASSQQSGLDYTTQIQVLQSPQLMTPIVKQIQTRYPDMSYGSLVSNLKITRFQETKILEVHYQNPNPQKVQFVLEQLAKGYLKYSLQERQTNLRQGIQFVEENLPQLRLRVNTLQRELQRFRQQYNFIDPEGKAGQLSGQIGTVQQQRLDTQKQLAETRAVYATLQGQSGATSALNEAPVYQKLLGQLRDVESQAATESSRFKQNTPFVRVLQRQRENLLPLLRQEAGRVLGSKLAEVANQILVLEVRAAAIAQAETNLDQQVKQLPGLARQYTDLQRELKVATDSLNRFLEKRESLQVEAAQKEVPWQMIAAPELPQPISADMNRNLILGTIGGVLAGIGAAFLLERLDSIFHSSDDLKNYTKLPILGVIPFNQELKKAAPVAETVSVKSATGLVFRNASLAQSENTFPFLEAFRSLHTNIGFLGSDTSIHSIVVTSSLTSEGKSTVSVNLAQAAAAMGQRVLLVDADLRLPQVHRLLGMPNEQGLSNAISSNLPVSEIIQRSLLEDNLFVLTSGQIPPDPTKLLSSRKMQSIMEQLRQKFDLVIYDTPPVIGMADSSLLATHTSGIVLVVRMDKTERSVLTETLDQLNMARTSVLGLVANGAKNHTSNSYSYYRRQYAQNAELRLPKERDNVSSS